MNGYIFMAYFQLAALRHTRLLYFLKASSCSWPTSRDILSSNQLLSIEEKSFTKVGQTCGYFPVLGFLKKASPRSLIEPYAQKITHAWRNQSAVKLETSTAWRIKRAVKSVMDNVLCVLLSLFCFCFLFFVFCFFCFFFFLGGGHSKANNISTL